MSMTRVVQERATIVRGIERGPRATVPFADMEDIRQYH